MFTKRFFIFGYWYSSNIGDSIAPWLVWKSLPADARYFFVNLIEPTLEDRVTSEILSVDGEILTIHKPSDVLNLIESSDILLLTVGSLTADQLAFTTISSLCSLQCEPRILIWGGIQDYTNILDNPLGFQEEIGAWRNIFSYSKLEFLARSQNEIMAIQAMLDGVIKGQNIRLAGDPVALFCSVLEGYINKAKLGNDFSEKRQTLLITSAHVFEREVVGVYDFHSMASANHNYYVIGIDPATDCLIRPEFINESVFSIYRLIDLIQSSDVVISTRLHGAVIAACLDAQVAAIGLNEKFINISNFNTDAILFDVVADFDQLVKFNVHNCDALNFFALSKSTIKYIEN